VFPVLLSPQEGQACSADSTISTCPSKPQFASAPIPSPHSPLSVSARGSQLDLFEAFREQGDIDGGASGAAGGKCETAGSRGEEEDWPLVLLVDDLPLNLKVMNRCGMI